MTGLDYCRNYLDNKGRDDFNDYIEILNSYRNKFKKLRETAGKFGIQVKNDITEKDDVLQTILSYIDSNKMDMVILGSRSRVGSDRFTLGSIALGTCKSAKCPVIIIK